MLASVIREAVERKQLCAVQFISAGALPCTTAPASWLVPSLAGPLPTSLPWEVPRTISNSRKPCDTRRFGKPIHIRASLSSYLDISVSSRSRVLDGLRSSLSYPTVGQAHPYEWFTVCFYRHRYARVRAGTRGVRYYGVRQRGVLRGSNNTIRRARQQRHGQAADITENLTRRYPRGK